MNWARLRIRSLILLVLLAGLVLGLEAWRRRPAIGILDDDTDEAFVRSYFKHAPASP
jgi:hypothetical protein